MSLPRKFLLFHEKLRIPANIATRSGGIVATHSGMIVAMYSGARLPPSYRSEATLAFMT
jgi:hypothetical protein